MRSLVEELFNRYSPVDCSAIIDSFNNRFVDLGIEGVTVTSCDYDEEGNIFVVFQDEDGDELEIIFTVDPEEGVIAINDQDEDDDYVTIVDLDTLLPSIDDTIFGVYPNLVDLSWLNPSGFYAILSGGDMDFESDEDISFQAKMNDPYGYMIDEDLKKIRIDEGRKVAVIRGGKKVKLAIVRKKRRKGLTGKQKSSIRKAVRKRKIKKAKTARKMKRSLKIRKRMKIKTPKLTGTQKVAGTANRKR